MKIWRITIGTEEGGGNIDSVVGVAEKAQEAIDKAMEVATGYKNPYPSKVENLGEQAF